MSIALVTVHLPRIENGIPIIRYGVTCGESEALNYSSDFYIRNTESMADNTERWKKDIATYCSEHGVTVGVEDVIIFGAPLVKGSSSFTDESLSTRLLSIITPSAPEPVVEKPLPPEPVPEPLVAEPELIIEPFVSPVVEELILEPIVVVEEPVFEPELIEVVVEPAPVEVVAVAEPIIEPEPVVVVEEVVEVPIEPTIEETPLLVHDIPIEIVPPAPIPEAPPPKLTLAERALEKFKHAFDWMTG